MIKRLKSKNKGFTMVELVVVIAILGIISSIILFNYNSFNSSVSLENLSQDIALTIRKAQIATIGINGVNVSDGINYARQFPSYGIHFSLSSNSSVPTGGSEKSFIYFADFGTPGSQTYNQSDMINCGEDFLSTSTNSPNECLDVINITSADKISSLCITDTSNSSQCYTPANNPVVDIAFARPNPEAYFHCTQGGISCVSTPISSVSIVLESIGAKRLKTVTVWNTGQISVN